MIPNRKLARLCVQNVVMTVIGHANPTTITRHGSPNCPQRFAAGGADVARGRRHRGWWRCSDGIGSHAGASGCRRNLVCPSRGANIERAMRLRIMRTGNFQHLNLRAIERLGLTVDIEAGLTRDNLQHRSDSQQIALVDG